MKDVVLTASLTLAIFAGAPFAEANEEGARTGTGMIFEQMDANGDGELTREEMTTHREARLRNMDRDGDGALTEAELRTGMKAREEARIDRRINHMMERHDADGDGKIAIEDVRPQRAAKMFDRADADGSGTISKAEFEAMAEKRRNNG